MFFKKRISVDEIGFILTQLLQNSEANEQLLQRSHPIANKDDVQVELIFLRSFINDYSLSVLSNPAIEKAVLQSYYGNFFKRIETKVKADDATVDDVGDILIEHIEAYTVAVDTPHENGPSWMIGKQFAKYCGHEMEMPYITLGSVVFVVHYATITALLKDFLKSFKIIF